MINDLAAARRDILHRRRVPVAYAFSGNINEAVCRKALELGSEDPMFRLDPFDKDRVNEVFYSLFGNLIKEDYAGA